MRDLGLDPPGYVDDVVERVADALEGGTVPAVIYNDARIHQAELERIFSRAWVFVGHESEIPHPGDYCLRYIADSAFIFVRDEAGAVHLFFDACRHRGTQLCRADIGNASHFRCPYHGWVYRNDGKLAGIPAITSAYKGFDRTGWGLIPAPHVESIHGLVFASLDPGAPPLDEYLGEMRWYLDLVFGLGKLRVVGEPQVWSIKANWKIGAENFAGDDYHTITLHKSMYDIGVIPVSPNVNMYGHHVLGSEPACPARYLVRARRRPRLPAVVGRTTGRDRPARQKCAHPRAARAGAPVSNHGRHGVPEPVVHLGLPERRSGAQAAGQHAGRASVAPARP